MSVSTKLQFSNNNHYDSNTKEYMVMDCKYEFTKNYNMTTRTTASNAENCVVVLLLVSPPKDYVFYEWYVNELNFSGRIIFDLSSINFEYDSSEERILSFRDAYCFDIAERYSIGENSQRLLEIKFVAKQFEVDDVNFNLRG